MTIRSLFSNHSILLISCLSLVAGSARVDAGEEASLDAKASSVKFVGDSFLHSFHGEAKDMSGSAGVDPAAVPPVQNAVLHFKTAELTTFHKGRDEKMFAWLNVKAHPEAVFQLEHVKLMAGDYKTADEGHPARFQVQGSFTLNGSKQALTGSALGWRDKDHLVVSGETVVDTLKYGLPQIREAFMTVATEVKVSYKLSFVLPSEYSVK